MDSLDVSDQEPNTVRDEGNAFHWLLEKPRPFKQYVDTKAKNGVLYTEEMAEHAEEYFNELSQISASWRGLEHPTTWTYDDLIQVRGRADYLAYCEITRTLHVIDAKYGYTLVEPEENYTLISHALGFIISMPYQVDRVEFTIYQPRGFHPDGVWRDHEVDRGALEVYLQRICQQARTQTHLRVGPHCDGCRAAHDCPALRRSVGSILDIMSGTYTDDLKPEQISHQMQLVDRAAALIKARQGALEDLTKYTLLQGKIVDGYMLEQTFSNRAWVEGFDAETIGLTLGINVVKTSIISPAQAEKAGADEEVVKALTERKYSGQKLVRRSADQAAKKAFGKGKR